MNESLSFKSVWGTSIKAITGNILWVIIALFTGPFLEICLTRIVGFSVMKQGQSGKAALTWNEATSGFGRSFGGYLGAIFFARILPLLIIGFIGLFLMNLGVGNVLLQGAVIGLIGFIYWLYSFFWIFANHAGILEYDTGWNSLTASKQMITGGKSFPSRNGWICIVYFLGISMVMGLVAGIFVPVFVGVAASGNIAALIGVSTLAYLVIFLVSLIGQAMLTSLFMLQSRNEGIRALDSWEKNYNHLAVVNQ